MPTELIPDFNRCKPRMQRGEKLFAEKLQQQLESDYLCWYDVPIGSRQFQPDFIVLNPRRGILVLEVKDWRKDTFTGQGDRFQMGIHTPNGVVMHTNPMSTARQNAMHVENVLSQHAALRNPPGHRYEGKLVMPYGWGVVFSHITRREFDALGLREIVEPSRVMCSDEILLGDAEQFQQRLWDMYSVSYPCLLTLPQVEAVRGLLFPELRIGGGSGQFGLLPPDLDEAATAATIPDMIRVMDIAQEQLARSIGDGHRVIHGVAGSGKTMILAFRCLHLAAALGKPILVLCYNVTLAARLRVLLAERGAGESVQVYSFHDWCGKQLDNSQVPRPKPTSDANAYNTALVESCIAGVERGQIPRAQYGALMIDEGHDFDAAWMKLAVQMVDPATDSVLVLYDDAQAIYSKGQRTNFSFASVGIKAQGRTTVMRLNYRNTFEILAVAKTFASDLLKPRDAEDEGQPTLAPESSGRRGPLPELVQCKSGAEEAALIARRIAEELRAGRAAEQIAILAADKYQLPTLQAALDAQGIAHFAATTSERKKALFTRKECVKLILLPSSKGLEFELCVIPLTSRKAANEEDGELQSRRLYVGMTRATHKLILTHTQPTPDSKRLAEAIRQVASASG